MKYFLLLIVLLSFACNAPGGNKMMEPVTATAVDYTKADLLKLKWIEGKWKGMDDDKPFYEIYAFINDSTIRTISYDWNGKDSSNSFTDHLYWKEGLFYLGDKQDWAVKTINDSMVQMLPNSSRIHNDITWKAKGTKGWDVILVSPKLTKEYHMQKFDPFVK
ncbi:hypothetical protein BH10BAC2_BH10BAC2_44290 [soil metagenome]